MNVNITISINGFTGNSTALLNKIKDVVLWADGMEDADYDIDIDEFEEDDDE